MERPSCSSKSKQSGQRCKRPAIKGGAVCYIHGGATPSVKLAAEERIRAMVDPALAQLLRIVESGDSDAVRLSAVKDVLDRAGYKPKERAEVDHKGGVTIYLPQRPAIQP